MKKDYFFAISILMLITALLKHETVFKMPGSKLSLINWYLYQTSCKPLKLMSQLTRGINDLSKPQQPAVDVRSNFNHVVSLIINFPAFVYWEKVVIQSNVGMEGDRISKSAQSALTYQIPALVYFIFFIILSLCCFVSDKAILENKSFISPYWKCQLIGWTVASLYWTVQGWTGGGFRFDLALVQLVSDVMLYILITHLYRIFALRSRWPDLSLNHLLWRMLVAIPVMGVFYTVVTLAKTYFIRVLFLTDTPLQFDDFFELNGLGIFMAGVRLMAIWLLAYHLYHYAKREIRLSGENARLELSFKQAQLDNLSAQLNPHFLFNSLNTIKSLIYTNPDSAGRGIDLLSELLRSGLYSGKSMLISLGQEMELVLDYLELEQLRMEERLTYHLNIDESLSGQMVPRLSLQALVENAVKHGVSLRKEGGKIDISVSEKEGFIYLRVTNPGRLDRDNSREGIGLCNLRERLEISYQGRASMNLVQQGEKVCAQIKVPVL